MDLWVLAAVAGAGYLVKNLQKISSDGKDSLGEQCSYNVQSKNFLHQVRDKTCLLQRLARETAETDVNISAFKDGLSNKDVGSVASISVDEIFPSMISAEKDLELDCEIRDVNKVQKEYSIISRRASMHSMRPLSSSRSRHNACRLKDRRNTVVNRMLTCNMLDDFNEERRVKDVGLRNIGPMLRSSSSFEQFESVEELQDKSRKRCEKSDAKGSDDSTSGKNDMFLFITGMTIGILFAARTWNIKTDSLSKQLKPIDNLVQDQHHELDMNEKLIFEELSSENNPQPPKNDSSSSIAFPTKEKLQNHVETLDDDALDSNVNVSENIELMSKIEGELQFELELLEQNIKASSALERLSNVVEIYPDLEIEVARGDLKLAKDIRDCSYESENEATHTLVACPQQINYAVSPWELTLRLHELLESRLQARVEELETALNHSTQRRAQVLHSQNNISGRRFYYNEMESSYTHPLTEDIFGEMRNLSSTVSFGRNYYPQVYESSSYSSSLGTVKDMNREMRDGESSRKVLDQRKPFIRPKI